MLPDFGLTTNLAWRKIVGFSAPSFISVIFRITQESTVEGKQRSGVALRIQLAVQKFAKPILRLLNRSGWIL